MLLDWLKCGPGKETFRSPGWTAQVKTASTSERQLNPLLLPEMQQLIAVMLEVLTPFPEARAAVAEAWARMAPVSNPVE